MMGRKSCGSGLSEAACSPQQELPTACLEHSYVTSALYGQFDIQDGAGSVQLSQESAITP